MTAIKVVAASFALVCMYVTASQANNIYYPAPSYGWGPWSTWCACTKKCAGGEQWRTRKCLNPPYYAGPHKCDGANRQTKTCNTYQCPINGGYGSYGPYSKCSKPCDGGYQTCYRKCNKPAPQYGGKRCSGPKSLTKACNTQHCPINGGYGSYGPYNKCSKPCGGGYQTCYRKCNNPAPQYGGNQCSGPKSITKACNTNHCPIHGGYGSYGPYDKCSKPCGGGYQTCYRKCNKPAPQYGGNKCTGAASITKACNVNNCPRHGKWSNWSSYGTCSRTCNGGSQKRTRQCNNPAPAYGGKDCVGDKEQTRKCGTKACAVYIGFVQPVYRVNEGAGNVVIKVKRTGDLSKVTSARVTLIPGGSATSGADHGNVDRDISFPASDAEIDVSISIADDKIDEKAEFFGVKLSSTDAAVVSVQPDQTRVIIIDNDVDGNWGSWSSWTKCDKSCGTGSQSRSRKCDNPAPKGGGKSCAGPASQTQKCYIIQNCPIHGGWSQWSSYGKCNKPCGGGVCYRSRTCTNPKPQYGGNGCSGAKKQSRTCNLKCCKVNGGYGAWSAWTPCSITCRATNYEVGYQKRTRLCCKPYPKCGGAKCVGPAKETKKCTPNAACPYVPPPAY